MEKIRGWVAYHPERGTILHELPQSKSIALDRLCMYEGYHDDGDFIPNTCPDDAIADGWRIRPVELRFTDEEICKMSNDKNASPDYVGSANRFFDQFEKEIRESAEGNKMNKLVELLVEAMRIKAEKNDDN